MKGFMYILLCDNETYYVGSTIDLEKRFDQHLRGKGANYTKENAPIEIVYFEEFEKVQDAFKREKQIQGWSRAKKEALINGEVSRLKKLAECENETHSRFNLKDI